MLMKYNNPPFMNFRVLYFAATIIAAFILTFAPNTTVSAQETCRDYHKKKCQGWSGRGGNPYGGKARRIKYTYNSQSRSAWFKSGDVSRLKITTHDGCAYRVTFCYDDKFTEYIEFRLLDYKTKEVLYSSGDEEFPNTVEFTSEGTKRVEIEITVPESADESVDVYACIGILIERSPPLPTGFSKN